MITVLGLSLVVFANMPIRLSIGWRVLFADVGGLMLLTGLLIPDSI